jgi:hypothetical protein
MQKSNYIKVLEPKKKKQKKGLDVRKNIDKMRVLLSYASSNTQPMFT